MAKKKIKDRDKLLDSHNNGNKFRDSSQVRKSLMDRDYKGEDYEVDQKLREGPMTDRKCTDCLFLIIFFAFVGVFGYVTVLGFENNPQYLLSPLDWDRKLCGLDKGYEEYNKLYFTAIPKINPDGSFPEPYEFEYFATCVSKCPVKDEDKLYCHTNAKVNQAVCDHHMSLSPY